MTTRDIFPFLLGFVLLTFCMAELFQVQAQPPRRRGGRRPPPGAQAPAPTGEAGAVETATPETPPSFQESLGMGEPPGLWTLDEKRPPGDETPTLRLGSLAPPVPAKVIRYATFLIADYDTDGSGSLEENEWKSLPGNPQAIDINADTVITLDELVRHIAIYGKGRTIHRPAPVPTYHRPTVAPDSLQLFYPRSPVAPPTPQLTEAPAQTTGGENEGATEVAEAAAELPDDATVGDDVSFEQLSAALRRPEMRKYHRSIEELRGVPLWFLRLDKDGDGQLTLLEFAPTLAPDRLASFAKLDKNGDGILTADEVRTVTPQP